MTNYRVFGNFSEKAKQCALLHVQGIIDEYENKICYAGYDYDWDMWNDRKRFLERIKEIIENK